MKTPRLPLFGALLAVGALSLGSCAALTATTAPDVPQPVSSLFGSLDDAKLRDTKVDPFANNHPAISKLDPQLRSALQEAAAAARQNGIKDFWVTSGWRSEGYQQQLLDEAVATYGSKAEASRWVASPTSSSHVTGHAVDVGPTDAADWLSRKGNRFGLCQVYANELWHYELLTTKGGDCPAMSSSAAG
ncbi:M15 family metallopeptidase [Glutamicibacter sp.]|uniref:M15 family metallopeptidase n=1 Tax=Glutamicibacter sp. TaxID=1931995 RepID=UPI0028BD619D|nr:M15 family metallopeptidase [Glutamicibacter sp.]